MDIIYEIKDKLNNLDVGDWGYFADGQTWVEALRIMADDPLLSGFYTEMVELHETLEAFLVKWKARFAGCDPRDGLEAINAFNELDGGAHPGFEPDAPHRNEHTFVTSIEMMLVAFLGQCWKDYEVVLDRTLKAAYPGDGQSLVEEEDSNVLG